MSANLRVFASANVDANLNILDSTIVNNSIDSRSLTTNNSVTLSGTITVSGTSSVTGSGTNFSQVIVAGDELLFTGCTSIFTVQSVTNNTNLTLTGSGPTLSGAVFQKLVKFVSNTSGITTTGGINGSGNLVVNGVSHSILGNSNFDSGVLFVDGVNNRVGINNTAPAVALQVTGDINATSFSTSGFVANTSAIIPTSNTILLGNTTGRFVISANSANFTGTVSGTVANMSTSVNSALITIGSNFIANSTDLQHTGTAKFREISFDNNDSGVNFFANTSFIRMPLGFSANSTTAALGTLFVANNSGLHTSGNGVVVKSGSISVGAGTSNTEIASGSVTSPVLNVINTTSTYLIANTTHSRIAGVLLANNTAGSAGQILYSAGSGANAYWSAPPSGATTATPSTIVARDSNGDIVANNFYATSDAVLKENINNINNPEKILDLIGKQYNFKGSDLMQYGFVAQEVENVIPEIVSKEGKFKGINYIQIIAMLVEVVKKQDKRLKDLENAKR